VEDALSSLRFLHLCAFSIDLQAKKGDYFYKKQKNMANSIKKIILLFFLCVIVIIGVFIAINFLPKIFFSMSETLAVSVIGGADGPTTIYISASPNWKLTLLYLLLWLTINILVILIIRIIEYKRKKKTALKYYIITLAIINIPVVFFLFPSILIRVYSLFRK
jgi:Na+-transporting methylmalonyl-CoA/oxaloacetate decarboxylase beta subunit